VEYAYAKQNKLTSVSLQNSAKVFVQANDDSFKAASAGAKWDQTFYQILTEQPGKDSWPITGATFILMHAKQDKPAQASSVLKFFNWAYLSGDKMADDLDYVPLPDVVKKHTDAAFGKITDVATGKPVAYK
jgi:phosphate transport system substrate-binding protein